MAPGLRGRMDLRITPEDYAIIARAAAQEGASISLFVREAAMSAARKVLKEDSAEA